MLGKDICNSTYLMVMSSDDQSVRLVVYKLKIGNPYRYSQVEIVVLNLKGRWSKSEFFYNNDYDCITNIFCLEKLSFA